MSLTPDFSEREQPADVLRVNESVLRDANPANVAKSLLEGNRDHLLVQARTELMKQEHKVESLNNFISELQQQAYAQRLDLENAHHGYVESRREQVRLQEELVVKEKVLRETQIWSMHEMWEMKRAQEIRVDEFSVQNLRESHETVQRLTSQGQEVQERMNYLNDSGELHEVESNFCGKCSHVPFQPARISSPRFMLSCDKRLHPETWNPSGPQENVFCKPTFDARVSTNTLPRDSSHDINCCRSGSRADQHRETCGKRGWKKRKPALWRSQGQRLWIWPVLLSRSPGGTQRFKSTGWIIREACCGKRKSKFQLRRSVEFSRMAKRCSTVLQYRETCGNGHGSELSESAGRIPQHRETCGNDDEWTPRMFRKNLKFQKIHEIHNLKADFGHISSKNHLNMCLTRKRSSRP